MILNKMEILGINSIYGLLLDFAIPLCQAHNPKVTGSSPVPATKMKTTFKRGGFFMGKSCWFPRCFGAVPATN